MSKPLPWDLVRELRAPAVAEFLGLIPARQRHKYECPVHGGSDSLHAYPEPGRGFYCFGCGQAFSTIDMAAAVWNVNAAQACERLARTFGIPLGVR